MVSSEVVEDAELTTLPPHDLTTRREEQPTPPGRVSPIPSRYAAPRNQRVSTNAKEAMHRRQLVAIAKHREEIKKPVDQQDKAKIMTDARRFRVCRRARSAGGRGPYIASSACAGFVSVGLRATDDPRRPQSILVSERGGHCHDDRPDRGHATRIRNANEIERPFVEMPATKLKVALAKVLHEEGFILGYRTGQHVKNADSGTG